MLWFLVFKIKMRTLNEFTIYRIEHGLNAPVVRTIHREGVLSLLRLILILSVYYARWPISLRWYMAVNQNDTEDCDCTMCRMGRIEERLKIIETMLKAIMKQRKIN